MKRAGWIVAAVGAVVLGLVVWALQPRAAEAAYVTAPAARGAITQTISLVGPVERDGQATLEYRSDGMVTAVHVKVGDQVTAGQQIVSIDPAPLRLSVLQARAQLAQAEAQLDADLAAQRSGGSSLPAGLGGALGGGLPSMPGGSGGFGGTGGLPTGGFPGGLPGGGAPGGGMPGGGQAPAYLTELNASLADLQTAVERQQTQCTPVFSALQRLRDLRESLPSPLPTALPTALPTTSPTATPTGSATPTPSPIPEPSASPEPTVGPEPSATPSATPSPEPPGSPDPNPGSPQPTASDEPTPRPSATPSPSVPGLPRLPDVDLDEQLDKLVGMADQVQACSDAMVGLAQAEGRAGMAIGAAAQGLAAQTQAATAAMAQAQAQLQEAMAAAQQQVEAAARAAAEDAIRKAQADLEAQMAASFGGMVTDATIANDRARLLQARQQLESAEADLAAATLTSPTSGVVGALDFAVGESSRGRSATVVGEGAARVTVEVPLAVRALVAPGVTARVGQLASPATLDGQVTGVSVLPGASGSPRYETTVITDDPDQTLRPGSWADVTLTLAQAADVLTIPSSAVTKVTDTTGTVEVVGAAMDQTADTVTVVTGRTGQGKVEVISGLADGQLVVLADRRLPVPGGIGQYAPPSQASPEPTARR